MRERLDDLEALVERFVARTFHKGPDRKLLDEFSAAAGLEAGIAPEVTLGPTGAGKSVRFVFARGSLAAMRRYAWPGNIRELEQLVANATVFALADALRALERGGRSTVDRLIPVPEKLIHQLLGSRGAPAAKPHRSLREVARTLEREHYLRLFATHRGDFAAMARELLGKGGDKEARQVRLRFNQLGLSARKLKS